MLFNFMICSVLIGAVFSAPVSGPDTYELVPGAKLEGDDQKAHSIPPRVNVQGREYGFDASGLKPHATAGQDPSDHRVFRYQFQQHEPMVDRMVYYQYEAKHRDNVKFVTVCRGTIEPIRMRWILKSSPHQPSHPWHCSAHSSALVHPILALLTSTKREAPIGILCRPKTCPHALWSPTATTPPPR